MCTDARAVVGCVLPGLDPKDIKVLLTGHAHSDHAGAHAYLRKVSGARIAVINEEKDCWSPTANSTSVNGELGVTRKAP